MEGAISDWIILYQPYTDLELKKYTATLAAFRFTLHRCWCWISSWHISNLTGSNSHLWGCQDFPCVTFSWRLSSVSSCPQLPKWNILVCKPEINWCDIKLIAFCCQLQHRVTKASANKIHLRCINMLIYNRRIIN